MTPVIHQVPVTAPASEAARLMIDQHIHRLVVTQGKEPVGIITSLDLLKVVAEQSRRIGLLFQFIQTSLRTVLEADHIQNALGRLRVAKSKGGSEPSEKSPFQALHPAIDEHEICCHGEGGPSKPCRNLSCRSLNDRRGAVVLDECPHSLDLSADRVAGPVSEPPHGPDNVMRARRFFRGHMPTGIHGGDQERDERVVSIECAHANWATRR